MVEAETANSEGLHGWDAVSFACEDDEEEERSGAGEGAGAGVKAGVLSDGVKGLKGMVEGGAPMIEGIVVVGLDDEPVIGAGAASVLGDTEEAVPGECEAVSATVKPITTANAVRTAMSRDVL